MEEIDQRLDRIKDLSEHYLIKARSEGYTYFDEFIEAANILKNVVSDNEFKHWCNEKMLMKDQTFAEKTFIQYAVETSAVRFFAEKNSKNFEVEVELNPKNNKDVDLQFTDKGYTYNVEVKCSDFESKEKIDNKDGFKYGTIGRIPNRKESIESISKALNEGLKKQRKPMKDHLESKNMDNNLKDFLELAHDKFNPNSKNEEINILLVGCDDVNDIQKWYFYLFANQGLFTLNSFANKENYKNVDLVILTNQYFKHNKYFEKNIENSWTLRKGFNLVFCNPFRRLPKEQGIKEFLHTFPHFTYELSEYEVPGKAPSHVKNSAKISLLVKDHLEKEKGIYLFEDNS
jgi:hypothetical protein